MIQRTITRALFTIVALGLAATAGAQTGIVKGKVIGPDGKPVPGAAISIELMDGVSRKLSTKSDKRGEFVQLGLQSGGYRITGTADKLGSGFTDLRVRSGSTAEVTVTLSPVPPGADPKLAAMKVAFDEGVAASRANDFDTAITRFQAAAAAQPACFECFYNMGFAYLQKKDDMQAEAQWKKALEVRADHAETLNALANLYNTQKRFDEAAAMTARAASSGGAGGADAIYNQGIILWNAGKIADAKVKFEEAVKADPAHADSRFQLGMALLNEGKIPDAVASFEAYMKMAPTGQFAAQAKAMLSQLKPPVR